jgi:hypothetical protein
MGLCRNLGCNRSGSGIYRPPLGNQKNAQHGVENFRNHPPSYVGEYRLSDFHAFIRASAQLINPGSVKVVYTLTLVGTVGSVTMETILGDMRSWWFVEKNAMQHLGPILRQGFYKDMSPLTRELTNTAVAEGWLHFYIKNFPDHRVADFPTYRLVAAKRGMGAGVSELRRNSPRLPNTEYNVRPKIEGLNA